MQSPEVTPEFQSAERTINRIWGCALFIILFIGLPLVLACTLWAVRLVALNYNELRHVVAGGT